MFREDKTTQMAARFLDLSDGCLPYIKLMKLLYIADKQMLVEHGKPITYDRWFALKYGPVLSSTYNIIKGETQATYWSDFIKTENYDLVLTKDPGSDALSVAEDRIIETVYEKYRDHTRWDMVDVVHLMPEWEDPGDSSREMTYESVLRTEGFGDEEINHTLENIRVQDDIRLVLETLCRRLSEQAMPSCWAV